MGGRKGKTKIRPAPTQSPSRNPANCAIARGSPVEADPEVDAVCPEVRPLERVDGSRGGDRSRVRDEVRDVGHIEHRVDLVARPNDAAPVEETVTGEQGDPFGEMVPQVQPDLRDGGEGVARHTTDVHTR